MVNVLKAVGQFVGLFAAVSVLAAVSDRIVRAITGPPEYEVKTAEFRESVKRSFFWVFLILAVIVLAVLWVPLPVF